MDAIWHKHTRVCEYLLCVHVCVMCTVHGACACACTRARMRGCVPCQRMKYRMGQALRYTSPAMSRYFVHVLACVRAHPWPSVCTVARACVHVCMMRTCGRAFSNISRGPRSITCAVCMCTCAYIHLHSLPAALSLAFARPPIHACTECVGPDTPHQPRSPRLAALPLSPSPSHAPVCACACVRVCVRVCMRACMRLHTAPSSALESLCPLCDRSVVALRVPTAVSRSPIYVRHMAECRVCPCMRGCARVCKHRRRKELWRRLLCRRRRFECC